MINGKLTRPWLLDKGVQVMVDDIWVTARIFRRNGDVDSLICAFLTRVAAASSSESGRESQPAQGNVAQRLFVAPAPRWADVVKDDEVWVDSSRYRVVAVDVYPHDQQLLLRQIQ